MLKYNTAAKSTYLQRRTLEQSHLYFSKKPQSDPVRPKRTTIGNGLEIPRMINGTWQFAGGHDKITDITRAPEYMNTPLATISLKHFRLRDFRML
ncbi:hypothetical protein BJX99DRAFT_225009 [Aspergillus californicus]